VVQHDTGADRLVRDGAYDFSLDKCVVEMRFAIVTNGHSHDFPPKRGDARGSRT
jgi:hypothetical protein